MRSTDKKIIRRVIAVGILIAVILCMNHVAVLSFDRVRNADYFNYDMEQLEKQHADVDLMIVGASQVYHGCNPDVISAEMGIHEVVECASAASHNDGMYYMLKDLLGRFTPKCVVIDLTWSKFMDKNVPVLSMAKLLSADRMSWPRKIEYAAHNFNLDEWMKLLFPMYRYGGSVWGFSQLKANYLARKAVREGNWVDESKRTYRKNGFTWVNAGCPQGSIPSEVVSYSNDLVSSYETDYMKKLWKLCDEKGVQVIWCTLPTSMVELYGIQNYQDSPDYMKAFAEELGCTYLNFNLLKGREAFLPDTCFSDKVHLNGTGSVAFSKVFAQAVKKVLDGEDPSGMFYENIDEMKKNVHRILGCNGMVNPVGDGTLSVTVTSLQNEDITPEYRLVLMEKGKKKKARKNNDVSGSGAGDADADEDVGTDAGAENYPEVRPWQEETAFSVEESEVPDGYALRVEVRQKGKRDMEAFQDELGSTYKIKMGD